MPLQFAVRQLCCTLISLSPGIAGHWHTPATPPSFVSSHPLQVPRWPRATGTACCTLACVCVVNAMFTVGPMGAQQIIVHGTQNGGDQMGRRQKFIGPLMGEGLFLKSAAGGGVLGWPGDHIATTAHASMAVLGAAAAAAAPPGPAAATAGVGAAPP
jgi:hypothetical protein